MIDQRDETRCGARSARTRRGAGRARPPRGAPCSRARTGSAMGSGAGRRGRPGRETRSRSAAVTSTAFHHAQWSWRTKKATSAGLVSTATTVAARVSRRQLAASSRDASLDASPTRLSGSIGSGPTGSTLVVIARVYARPEKTDVDAELTVRPRCYGPGMTHATLHTSEGRSRSSSFPDEAPKTVENFRSSPARASTTA